MKKKKANNFYKKKFAGIPMIVILLVLCGLMTVFAAWILSFYMQGTVTTGDVKCSIVVTESWDPSGANDPDYINGTQGPDYPGGTTVRHNFNQGCTEVSASGNVVTFTITNAYPDYVGGATLELKNTGNIPLKVTGITFGGDTSVLDVALIDISEGEALGAGQTLKFGLGVHVTEDISPSTTYGFSVVFNVEYNEEGW